ncbi:XK-related protein 6 [Procambarus clarkii]|uniref:XK-related protein 6 n=1 Tax=Procambarus clarkii TaxID=6728 RepID=UPI001E674809|nr:XK-related protein 6-like [Procambarus clarkii]XP_045594141.1 XK-related protein 6-like [Procambarus clarkii]
MSFKRESDDYVHHRPKAGKPPSPPQFTWLECVWMVVVSVSYLVGYCVQLSIVVDKYTQEEPPPGCGLYLLFFLLPHLAAGLKNLQYHFREAREEEGEDGAMGWVLAIVCLPFSPLIRFSRAWRFGVGEKTNWEDGIRYVDEMVTVGVLRLFEVLLGDAPMLCLLLRDDVWGRSYDWREYSQGPQDLLQCGPRCVLQPQNPITFWIVFRMLFLLSKMAQCVTFYLVIVKRLQRLQQPQYFQHLRGTNSRQGRLHFFATLVLYLAHFFLIGSRVTGYSMVGTAWGPWVYFIAGTHWVVNTVWHLISVLNSRGLTPARSVSSLLVGAVWLIALTNEQGGRQLGRFILYYMLAFFETVACGYLWNFAMAGSGDFFANKAPWFMLVIFMIGLMLQIMYYAICHPSKPSFTKRGLLCCSGDRRDPIDSDDERRM